MPVFASENRRGFDAPQAKRRVFARSREAARFQRTLAEIRVVHAGGDSAEILRQSPAEIRVAVARPQTKTCLRGAASCAYMRRGVLAGWRGFERDFRFAKLRSLKLQRLRLRTAVSTTAVAAIAVAIAATAIAAIANAIAATAVAAIAMAAPQFQRLQLQRLRLQLQRLQLQRLRLPLQRL